MINILKSNYVSDDNCIAVLEELGINSSNNLSNYVKIENNNELMLKKDNNYYTSIVFYDKNSNMKISLLKSKLDEYNIVNNEKKEVNFFVITREKFNIFMVESLENSKVIKKYYFAHNGYYNRYNSLKELTHYMIEAELLPEYAQSLDENDFKLVIDPKNGFNNTMNVIDYKRERFNCNKK